MSEPYSVRLFYREESTPLRYGLRCRSDAGAKKASKAWLAEVAETGRIEVECGTRKIGTWTCPARPDWKAAEAEDK